jgi:Slx4 endonuclease
MATVDLLLSSSPPRFGGCQTVTMSSSPVFPSPNALVQKRPQLKSGSRADAVPAFATFSFTSVAHLPNERQSTKPAAAAEDPFSDKPAKPKPSKKPRVVEKVIDGNEPIIKKPRKPRAKKVEVESGDIAAPVVKPPRKPRAKKNAAESQPRIPKGKVTKASTGSQAEKAASKKKTGATSGHFASAPAESKSTDINKSSENDLLLQEAVRRRRSWTPPKTTPDPSMIATVHCETEGIPSLLSGASGDKQKTITDLLRNFGYSNGGDRTIQERIIDQPGTKKRKLIELVKMNNSAVEPPVAKVKTVKKKPRTITDLATSAYAADINEEESDVLPAPLLQYFSYEDSLSEKVSGTMDGFKIPPKPRSKSPVKTSSKAPKVKKGTAQAPILLSPQSALKRVEKQEFVFGTSSQLAREDSPTLLRDLQQAMRSSNQVEEDPFTDIIGSLSPSTSASATERGTEAYMAKRNLWAAASRGVDGALMDVETVDLSESPQVLMSAKPFVPASGQRDIALYSTSIPVDDGWHDLDRDDSTIKEINQIVKPQPPRFGPVEAAIQSELLSSPVKDIETRKTSSSKPTALASKPSAKADIPSEQPPAPQMPDYGSYPTAKLAKEIASYHFKPVKGRDQMISLLEKCWEGRQKAASDNTEKAQECEISTSNSNKPLVLRQTPKKQKKASRVPEEIYDSESPLTPSPPHRQNKVRTPPPHLLFSVSEDPDESLVLSPTSEQLRLHKHITRAITTAPPSKDPKNPSWYEKILLYDPIVLEDLAAWLNTGALERVGWDGEVGPHEVKRWCLEKSICCLWRENLRGEVRSRY